MLPTKRTLATELSTNIDGMTTLRGEQRHPRGASELLVPVQRWATARVNLPTSSWHFFFEYCQGLALQRGPNSAYACLAAKGLSMPRASRVLQ